MKNKEKAEDILGFIEILTIKLEEELSNTNPNAQNIIIRLKSKQELLANLIQLED